MSTNAFHKVSRRLVAIGLVLVFVCVLIAALNQTAMGSIAIKQISIVSDEGNVVKAVMYLPKTATKENPAPGVLAVHGGNSSRYAMGNISQEFARRGYVVISIDQSFNGQSDRGTNDYNGSEAVMKYMTELEFVDQTRLGVMGHSAGGVVTTMAVDNPQFNVKAAVNLGVGPTLDATAKINLAVIIGLKDENTGPRGADTHVRGPIDYAKATALLTAFGVTDSDTVIPEQKYGSLEDDNLRVFYQPNCGHLGMLYSNEAIGMALTFMGEVLGVDYSIDVNNQNWIVREIATAVAYVGLFLCVFGVAGIMLVRRKEGLLLAEAAGGHATPNLPYWVGLLVMCIVPAIGIQDLYTLGKTVLTTISKRAFAMEHINGVIFWMLCTAVVILLVNLGLKKLDKNYDWSFDRNILIADRKQIKGYLIVALFAALTAYLLVYLAGFFGDVCIRLYNTEIHLFTTTRFYVFWAYLPLYLIYYVIIGYVQTSGLLCKGQSAISQYLRTAIVSVMGPGIMLIAWYGTVGFTGINYLFVWRFVLGVLLNFLPGMAIGAIIQVYAYRHTGKIWLGAFLNSILFSWMATSIGVMISAV